MRIRELEGGAFEMAGGQGRKSRLPDSDEVGVDDQRECGNGPELEVVPSSERMMWNGERLYTHIQPQIGYDSPILY